ncbi:Nicotinamide phosphoribosyltransferase [Dirofilaria immitis]
MESVENVLYVADSYKVTHHNQYPEGTTHVYSYFESRGGKFPEVCFFGLQYIIKRWLVGPVVTKTMVEEAKQFYKSHFGGLDIFNEEGWNHIVEVHKGYLPLKIKAVPEGTVVPVKNVLFTVENTDPRVPWLTNWFETLLVQVWYPITVCTNSRAQKLIIARYLHETADSIDGIHFKLHDFGYRGASSVESASIGGAAHLVNFYGTDTIAGLQLCKKYYAAEMAGFSIPAAEHSTITTWKKSGESAAYLNMLEQFPDGSVSVVSDSYDVFHAVSNIWGDELRQYVVDRANKGCVVIRPDSGDPSEVVVKVLNLLAEKFPTVTNSKGYRLLPSYLRVIQGDGVCYESLGNILDAVTRNKWSADNIVFGTGGALLQKLDRDTQKCAFKCSHVVINGESRDVWKSPTTDTGKQSKQGRLTLERREDGSLVTIEKGKGDVSKDILVTVFENGKLLVDYSLEEIRNRAELDIVKEHKRKAVNVEATAKTTNDGSWVSANVKRDGLAVSIITLPRRLIHSCSCAVRDLLSISEDVAIDLDEPIILAMFLRCTVSLRTNSVRFNSAKQRLKNYVFPVIRSEDCVQKFISGWGPGGQKVNMTRNAVTIKHVPTGVVVRVHQSRLLQENIEIAQERLKHAVDRHLNGENSYDSQLERMERERGVKIKKKRAAKRELKKSYAQERSNSESEEVRDQK